MAKIERLLKRLVNKVMGPPRRDEAETIIQMTIGEDVWTYWTSKDPGKTAKELIEGALDALYGSEEKCKEIKELRTERRQGGSRVGQRVVNLLVPIESRKLARCQMALTTDDHVLPESVEKTLVEAIVSAVGDAGGEEDWLAGAVIAGMDLSRDNSLRTGIDERPLRFGEGETEAARTIAAGTIAIAVAAWIAAVAAIAEAIMTAFTLAWSG